MKKDLGSYSSALKQTKAHSLSCVKFFYLSPEIWRKEWQENLEIEAKCISHIPFKFKKLIQTSTQLWVKWFQITKMQRFLHQFLVNHLSLAKSHVSNHLALQSCEGFLISNSASILLNTERGQASAKFVRITSVQHQNKEVSLSETSHLTPSTMVWRVSREERDFTKGKWMSRMTPL